MMDRAHRNTILVEDAEILSHEAMDGDQYILRVHAPGCAARARAGQFAHITVDPQRPMRRPISIMRAAADAGWLEFLYKVVGDGSSLLTRRAPQRHGSNRHPLHRRAPVPPADWRRGRHAANGIYRRVAAPW